MNIIWIKASLSILSLYKLGSFCWTALLPLLLPFILVVGFLYNFYITSIPHESILLSPCLLSGDSNQSPEFSKTDKGGGSFSNEGLNPYYVTGFSDGRVVFL
uniref:Uncharacterized protein n=1 Tax=Juglanconis juglandina TaxID=1940567 RepID=A0A291LIT6_9PEZI|nr:hypothetical protein [Juglanconis juglandina]